MHSDVGRGREEQSHRRPPTPKSQWGIHWLAPTTMLVTFGLAVCTAAGNHALYSSVAGQEAFSQDWILRGGTALAVTCKICLSVSLGVSLSQWTWRAVRNNFISLSSLDTLFAATQRPWALFNLELLSKASIALILAVFIWLAPLIPVFAPGSLTVGLYTISSRPSLRVPNLNFNSTSNSDSSLDFISSELTGSKLVSDSYRGPTKAALAIVYEAIYGGTIAAAPSPCGSNCTFAQSFHGPSYQCNSIDSLDPNAPWCFDRGSKPNGSCISAPPLTKDLYFGSNSTTSDGKNDFQLWVRHRYVAPENRRNKTGSGQQTISPEFGVPFEDIAFRCQMMKTRYDIRRSYVNSNQIITGTWTPIEPYDFASRDNPGSLTKPINPKKEFAELWAANGIHDAISSIFGLNLIWQSYQDLTEWVPHQGLALTGTAFVERYPWPKPVDHLPVRNLKELLRDLSVNITLSLFATPALGYFEDQDTLAQQSSNRLIFLYDSQTLLATYGAALFVGLVSIISGAVAFAGNGVSMDTGFLNILATTRNPTLDSLAQGTCLGASGDSMDRLRKVEVRLGEVQRNHVTIGTRDEIQPLQNGAPYI